MLLLLFCGVGLGFWLSAQRQAVMLAKPGPRIADATGSLSSEQKQLLDEYAEQFLATYGVALTIRIQNEPFPEDVLPAPEKTRTFFLGLSPRTGHVRLEIPPLAAAPLGAQCIDYLRHEHFRPYFARGNWPEGLVAALNLLTKKLDHALPERSTTIRRLSAP